MATFKLIGRNEYPSTTPSRIGKMDVAYAYMDEAMHTVMLVIPAEEDSPERVEKELRDRATSAAKAGPKEITI